ncbi:hypothetical protein I4U23_011002 [Adineta vaga]|nr:hypothetical protein I4U23_011002 [Adineta vaga]
MRSLSTITQTQVNLFRIQNNFAGPVAGNTCCALCCSPLILAGGLPGLGCVASCIGTLGTAPPCIVCVAAFLAPTP